MGFSSCYSWNFGLFVALIVMASSDHLSGGDERPATSPEAKKKAEREKGPTERHKGLLGCLGLDCLALWSLRRAL